MGLICARESIKEMVSDLPKLLSIPVSCAPLFDMAIKNWLLRIIGFTPPPKAGRIFQIHER